MSPPVPTRAWLAFALLCVVWGTTYFGIKIALESVPPLLLGGLRFLTAGLLLSSGLWLAGRPLPPLRSLPAFLLVGTLLLGFGNGGVTVAEQWMTTGLTAVLVAATPFWMVTIEALLPRGERLTRRTLLGLALGFGGIVLLVWPDLVGSGATVQHPRWGYGVLATQLACVGWAIGSAFSKRRISGIEPLTAAAWQMLFGGLVLVTAGTLMGEWAMLSFTPRTGLAMGYLLVAGSLLGYVAYIYVLGHLPTSTVSLYPYINTVVAVLLGTWLLREPLRLRSVLAIGVILAGSAIVTSARLTARPSPPATTAPMPDEAAQAAAAAPRVEPSGSGR